MKNYLINYSKNYLMFNSILHRLQLLIIMKNQQKSIRLTQMSTFILLTVAFLFGTVMVQAQTVSSTDNVARADADGVSVKLIDNKGTIKYLQSNNGITTITSTEAGDKTTTTWQLGGQLLADTYIDVEGKVFSLDGLKLETGSAAVSATTQTGHDAGTTTTASTDTGWTLVVRDEATGELRKLLATNLIQSGYAIDTADAAEETANEIVISAAGIPALAGNEGKIWVYRNGAKLLHTTDFTVDATAGTVTATGTANWTLYTGDVFEVQWVK